MKIKVFDNQQLAATYVAKYIDNAVKHNPKIVLGLATGSTPISTYGELIKLHQQNHTSYAQVTTFNLDEYDGIDHKHPQSYHYFMEQELFKSLDLNHQKSFFPDLKHDYDQLIKQAGGIDIQILGIGSNGHIAFNEPGSDLNSQTRKITLADSTINDNARFFNNVNEVPKSAISMGIATILQARKIFILAFGKNKHAAVKQLLASKEFDRNFPASALALHSDVEIIVDKEAIDDL
ncbi:glucosamine-6-phosphate deaminase [Candidatus Mycoplasma pogonae]